MAIGAKGLKIFETIMDTEEIEVTIRFEYPARCVVDSYGNDVVYIHESRFVQSTLLAGVVVALQTLTPPVKPSPTLPIAGLMPLFPNTLRQRPRAEVARPTVFCLVILDPTIYTNWTLSG